MLKKHPEGEIKPQGKSDHMEEEGYWDEEQQGDLRAR